MADLYQQLLAATIDRLEQLDANGCHFVDVDLQLLDSLNTTQRPSRRTTHPSSRARSHPEPEPPTQAAAAPPPLLSASPAADSNFDLSIQPGPDAETNAPSGVELSPLTPEQKEQAMAELWERTRICQKCSHLVRSRTNVVFGVGNIHSPLMFVGEAPGADEDRQGEPFVGKAGQLLTKIIQTMGFDRESVYIANILKCRPDTPGQASGNRKPTVSEMQTCFPYLAAQLDIIRPRVIVALGATAVEGLLGKKGGITHLRGHWQEFRGIALMPTYHPAYLLRNQARSEKRKVWEDMLQVLERLGAPVSEKQRNYFKG